MNCVRMENKIPNRAPTMSGIQRRILPCYCFLVWSCSFGHAAEQKIVEIKIRDLDPGEAAKVSYARQIKPILENNCAECHSAEERKSQFDVSAVSTLLQKGKKAGPGVVPGKPDESAIVQYIRGQ